ncbi:hypothetical protein TanjilG_07286 [Lupinus angustifolius]|uniref:Uncharacterized protein n=1 Tax=Lupinus angustifolius TaxID=3871 RepID=A0A1J7IVM6_LUPAN|nr:hypothetical protein TanjilG_07286 [Lupinus angustifolius]
MYGETPLHMATKNGFNEAAQLLLSHDASVFLEAAKIPTKRHYMYLLYGPRYLLLLTPCSSSLPISNANNNCSCNKVSPLMAMTSCPSSSESAAPSLESTFKERLHHSQKKEKRIICFGKSDIDG